MLFVLPVVAMVGFSLGAALRQEPIAAAGLLGLGALLLTASFSRHVRQRVRHRLSADFALVREGRRLAERLERT